MSTSLMTASLPKLIERKRRLEREIAEIDHIIEAQALRLAKEQTGRVQRSVVHLTFGKNVITWGNGNALAVKGKGYQFVKALYEAKKMRLKITTLDKVVWGETKMVKQHTFVVFLHWLSEKLEIAKFPYRLIPIMSKERTKNTGAMRNGKPIKKRSPPEMTGAKLCIR